MRQILFFIAVCYAGSLFAGTDVHIESAFARASIPGMSVGAAFMQLKNTGKKQRLLVEARSDTARFIEFHNHTHVNGMMRMRKTADIRINPGQTTTLKPGGLHIMLLGLQHPLKEGESFQLTLVFDDGCSQTIHVPVKSISATP